VADFMGAFEDPALTDDDGSDSADHEAHLAELDALLRAEELLMVRARRRPVQSLAYMLILQDQYYYD
jgi:hypothetical protein